MSRTFSIVYTSVKALCVTFIVLCAIGLFYSVGPALETAYWPVVSKLKVEQLKPGTQGWTWHGPGRTQSARACSA